VIVNCAQRENKRDQRKRKDHDRDHRYDRPVIGRRKLATRRSIARGLLRPVKRALQVG
jgi:hypothetical protein